MNSYFLCFLIVLLLLKIIIKNQKEMDVKAIFPLFYNHKTHLCITVIHE